MNCMFWVSVGFVKLISQWWVVPGAGEEALLLGLGWV